MSLILDALNRSRQDKEHTPGLGSHHPTDTALVAAQGGIGWVQWLLVAGLALAVLVIGWLLFDRMSPAAHLPADTDGRLPVSEAVPTVVTVPARTVPVAVRETLQVQQTPAPQREKIPEVPASPAVTFSPQERSLRDTPKQESTPPTVDSSVAALYQQQGQVDSEAPAAKRSASANLPEVTSVEEEAVDIEKLVMEAQAELADARLPDTGVPFLATLSQQTKDAIPTLMYQRHDYSGKPGKSSVLINGKTLNTGASVGGVKVVEILPQSVVLEFKGTRFRLRALNSWVNL